MPASPFSWVDERDADQPDDIINIPSDEDDEGIVHPAPDDDETSLDAGQAASFEEGVARIASTHGHCPSYDPQSGYQGTLYIDEIPPAFHPEEEDLVRFRDCPINAHSSSSRFLLNAHDVSSNVHAELSRLRSAIPHNVDVLGMKEMYERYEAKDNRYKFKSLSSLFVRQRYSYGKSVLFSEDEKKSDLMMLGRAQCDVDQLAVVGTPTSRFRLLLPTNTASIERYSWQLTMFPNKTSYHRLFKDKKCKVGSRVDGNSIFLGFVGTMQVFMIFSSRDEEPIGAGCHMSGSDNSVRLPYESWLHFVTFLIWCMDQAGIPGCTVENKILHGSPTLRMAENNAPAMKSPFIVIRDDKIEAFSETFDREYPIWVEEVRRKSACKIFTNTDPVLYIGMYGQKDILETQEDRKIHIRVVSKLIDFRHVAYFTIAPASTHSATWFPHRRVPCLDGLVRHYICNSPIRFLFIDEACTVPLTEATLEAYDEEHDILDRNSGTQEDAFIYMKNTISGTVTPCARCPLKNSTAKDCGVVLNLDRALMWWKGRLEPGMQIADKCVIPGVLTFPLGFSDNLGNVSCMKSSPQPIEAACKTLNDSMLDEYGIHQLVETGGCQIYNNVAHYMRPNGSPLDPAQSLHTSVVGITPMITRSTPDHFEPLFTLNETQVDALQTKSQNARNLRSIHDFKSKIANAAKHSSIGLRFENIIVINVNVLRSYDEELENNEDLEGDNRERLLKPQFVYDRIIWPMTDFWLSDHNMFGQRNRTLMMDMVEIFRPKMFPSCFLWVLTPVFTMLEVLTSSLWTDTNRTAFLRPAYAQTVACATALMERIFVYAISGNSTVFPYYLAKMTFIAESIAQDGKPVVTAFLSRKGTHTDFIGKWIEIKRELWPRRVSPEGDGDWRATAPLEAARSAIEFHWGRKAAEWFMRYAMIDQLHNYVPYPNWRMTPYVYAAEVGSFETMVLHLVHTWIKDVVAFASKKLIATFWATVDDEPENQAYMGVGQSGRQGVPGSGRQALAKLRAWMNESQPLSRKAWEDKYKGPYFLMHGRDPRIVPQTVIGTAVGKAFRDHLSLKRNKKNPGRPLVPNGEAQNLLPLIAQRIQSQHRTENWERVLDDAVHFAFVHAGVVFIPWSRPLANPPPRSSSSHPSAPPVEEDCWCLVILNKNPERPGTQSTLPWTGKSINVIAPPEPPKEMGEKWHIESCNLHNILDHLSQTGTAPEEVMAYSPFPGPAHGASRGYTEAWRSLQCLPQRAGGADQANPDESEQPDLRHGCIDVTHWLHRCLLFFSFVYAKLGSRSINKALRQNHLFEEFCNRPNMKNRCPLPVARNTPCPPPPPRSTGSDKKKTRGLTPYDKWKRGQLSDYYIQLQPFEDAKAFQTAKGIPGFQARFIRIFRSLFIALDPLFEPYHDDKRGKDFTDVNGVMLPVYMAIKLGLAYTTGENSSVLTSPNSSSYKYISLTLLERRWMEIEAAVSSSVWKSRGWEALSIIFPNWPTADLHRIVESGIAWAPKEVLDKMGGHVVIPRQPDSPYTEPDADEMLRASRASLVRPSPALTKLSESLDSHK
ncbi:hypothetical protein SISSUDRAFT_1067417 [Sistotremastrum suecicum HHB10207 ss-3]|uniref:Uncharacterized protein n=1 Tax=Sistotremastrum suecicum HHB10207 ss-3 TaxID=1314776 RepID=A0A165X597_9AGAM|nr:hypothetical protein SISSUDRAFT_1067417 [Sistotremastrum suecicum HHB10207 ss-3]